MNYATIKYYDVANGPGVRTSLFVSGCTHHCKECFNAIAWDFSYGEPFTPAVAHSLIESCRPAYIEGLTLLGGEPMEPENQLAVLSLVKAFREQLPNKTIWCYSGYTWEQLTGQTPARCRVEDVTDELLSLLNVLVDGRFVLELHDITLRFRGSSNQRLIDVPKTLQNHQIVWWQDDPLFASHQLPR